MDAATIISEFTHRVGLPREALTAATAQKEKLAPFFIEQIEVYLARSPDRLPAHALFFVFHLLGEWREQRAYRTLARLMRAEPDLLDPLVGGGVTETSHRVMAAVFDGDPEPLYEVILDPKADEFIRARMLEALGMLVRQGRLDRSKIAEFLRDCFTKLEPKDECFVWIGWQSAIAMLGLEELSDLVKQAFDRGFIGLEWMDFDDFREDLEHAIEDPNSEHSVHEGEYSLFGNTIEELSNWYTFSEEFLEARAKWKQEQKERIRDNAAHHQWINPFRHVGRNDPCPCGSGKKAKKCCLRSPLEL